jgi:large subunit ribosomal protein L17
MRHRRAGRKLGRNATHRLALYRNLALALFRHERIITTLEKAKAVRPFVEKLITLAKNASLHPEQALHARRLVLSRLGTPSNAAVKPPDLVDKTGDPTKVIVKLFTEIGPRFKDRPGGYTRVIKRHQRRLGDGGKTAFLELLKEGETKVRSQEAAPAPRVEEEMPPTEEQVPETQGQIEQPPAEQPPAPEGETPPEPTGSAENPPKT